MNRKLIFFVSTIVSAAMLLTGCGQAKAPAGQRTSSTERKILRVNNQTEPGSLHPGKAQGTHDSWIIEHVMEGLTKKSPDGKVVPGMAQEWKISDDGLTYTFTLQDDIKWTNGDPVTAQDFEYAWKYALAPSTASEYAYQLYYLKGAEAFNTSTEKDPKKLKALEAAVGVKALEDKTLEVQLVKPTPYFIELQSFYTYLPVNKKVQEANPNWANEPSTYVSNGVFKISEWKHKESIKIVKSDSYYDKGKIKLDEIDFAMIEDENTAYQMYKSGDMDVAYPLPTDVIAQLKAVKDPEFVIAPDLATYFYRFNTTKKPFNNKKVRKALSMAIDRQAIVDNVTQGGQKPAFSYTPPGILDVKGDYQQNTGDLFKYDAAQAKKLLSEGLKEVGMHKMPVVTITYNTMDAHKKIAEAIQEMWRKNLGIEVKLENVEFQVKIDREHKLDYDISRSGWIGDYVDPMTFLDMFESKSQQNDTGWKNSQYDALIQKAKSTMDTAARMKELHEAEKIFIDEMPIAPIYFYTKPYQAKSYVKGIFSPVNRYPQFQYADIQK